MKHCNVQLLYLRAFLAAVLSLSSGPVLAAERLTLSVTEDPAEAVGEVVLQGYRNIYAAGPIRAGDADRFAAFVRERRLDAARVVFDSPGGSLLEGIKLGRLIRALGFDTAIGSSGRSATISSGAICASACAYAFAGGVLRFVSSDGGKLGLHQFRTVGETASSESEAQAISGLLVAYLSEMGVDANAFALASVTDPDGMVWLTADDAKALGFANNGVLPTTAEVKIVGMRPYLRLNQEQPGVGVRVLLICDKRRISMEAGIVTDTERSQGLVDRQWLKRSYLEFDGQQRLAMPSDAGAHAKDSVVWLSRQLGQADLQLLTRTNDLGIWLDGFGILRVGGTMDLRRVRPAIENYIVQCVS